MVASFDVGHKTNSEVGKLRRVRLEVDREKLGVHRTYVYVVVTVGVTWSLESDS